MLRVMIFIVLTKNIRKLKIIRTNTQVSGKRDVADTGFKYFRLQSSGDGLKVCTIQSPKCPKLLVSCS